jgi:hypothetical protein
MKWFHFEISENAMNRDRRGSSTGWYEFQLALLQTELDQMGLSALGNQDRIKLTLQMEITSSSLTSELNREKCLVGRADEFVVIVRMVEIKRLMGEIAGPVRHLVIKCQVCTLHGDVR